jgi:GrpB-like predicted nucleotidyltransferase (UPF0157 family)
MKNKLEEMTQEELWQLFPIFLVKYRVEWADWYQEESCSLLNQLPEGLVKRIAHVGSTAIPGIWAKNIVDILLEVGIKEDLVVLVEILKAKGWRVMYQESDQCSLNKGYTDDGFADRVFHLHLRLVGDHDELYFRDYLLDHPEIAKDYEQLKLGLWKQFEHDRKSYTDAKTDFIQRYTQLAKQDYEGRYD